MDDASSGSIRTRLDPLTGLRFLAAFAVVLDHYWTAFVWWDPTKSAPSATAPQATGWQQVLQAGGHGVDCFFVLSGFILAYTYISPAGQFRGSRAGFWIARIARIYPIYLVGLAVDVVPFLMREHHLGGVLATVGSTPLLAQTWLPSVNTWNAWDPPSWSLSVEAFFYVCFPIAVVALARKSRRQLWLIAGLSVALFAIIPAALIITVEAWRPSSSWLLDQALYYNPLVRLPEFTLGIVLGILYTRRDKQSVPRCSGMPSPLYDIALLCLFAAAVGVAVIPLPPHYLAAPLLLPLFAAAIVILAQERGVIASLLARRVCVWLGEVSYSIYILHAPLWAWLAWIASSGLHVALASPILFPIYLMSVLIGSGLSYRFIERPARQAIRDWWATYEARALVNRTRVPTGATGRLRG
jgi:peptidoglycan/LPS O-acetylase OafA/YrhL